MTTVDVVFRYAAPPSAAQMTAIASTREVYGIRGLWFDEKASTVRVEYDATRLNDATVASLLRQTGLDIKEKVVLV